MPESKTSTTETLVAIGAVVFVFSLVGVLSVNPASDEPLTIFSGGEVGQTVEDSGAAMDEDAGTEEEVAASGGSVESDVVLSSGTSLSPAMSSFDVMK